MAAGETISRWLELLSFVTWVLCGTAWLVHYNLKKKTQRLMKFRIIHVFRLLRDSPIVILARGARWMQNSIERLYGSSTMSQLLITSALSFIYTAVLIICAHFYYSDWAAAWQEEKLLIEKSIDPELWRYRRDIPEAKSQIYGKLTFGGSMMPLEDHWKRLLKKIDSFNKEYEDRIRKHKYWLALSYLTFVEGTYVNPGFCFRGLIGCYAFNILFNCASFHLTMGALKRISARPTDKQFFFTFIKTLLLCFIMFHLLISPFSRFAQGSHQNLYGLVLGSALILICVTIWRAFEPQAHGNDVRIFFAITERLFCGDRSDLEVIAKIGFFPIFFISGILSVCWSVPKLIHFGWPAMKVDGFLNVFPFALAGSCLIPLAVCGTVMLGLLVAKGAREVIGRPLVWYLRMAIRRERKGNTPLMVWLFLLPAVLVEAIKRLMRIF